MLKLRWVCARCQRNQTGESKGFMAPHILKDLLEMYPGVQHSGCTRCKGKSDGLWLEIDLSEANNA